MSIYETLMLAVPEITDDETSRLEKQFVKLVTSLKGEVVSFERWGKFKLAYPVKGNNYGVFFLSRFKLPKADCLASMKELKSFFAIKFNDLIMRHINCVLPSVDSLKYKRPKSLEDSPTDVDTFLRENKMEGLLNKDPKKSLPSKKEVAIQEEKFESDKIDEVTNG